MSAADWDARYDAAELVWSAGPNRWVEELLTDREPGRAVDIAAGEGRNALWLAGRGWEVLATDYSAAGLERARQRAAELPEETRSRLRLLVADATEPVPRLETQLSYDVALLCYLQLPATQMTRALGHAVDALAPGGELVVVGHALANLTGGTGGPSDPDVLYDSRTVVDTLADLGLRVGEAAIRERPVEGAERPALDTVVTAEVPR
ncbi:MAG: class I SAM-dependent methyltransferase [Marmoricola sp.]